MAAKNIFPRTKLAVYKAIELLKCDKCHKETQHFETVAKCKHCFCKHCAKNFTGNECPLCKTFCYSNEKQTNCLLTEIAQTLNKIRSIVDSQETQTKNLPDANTHARDSTDSSDLDEMLGLPNVPKSNIPLVNLSHNEEILEDCREVADTGVEKKKSHRRDNQGNSRLQKACMSKKENVQMVKRLLTEDGINPNECDYNKWTPLHEAAALGHLVVVEMLLKAGSIVDATGGEDLITPLHDAIVNKKMSIIKILLEYGADPQRWDVFGTKAMEMSSSPAMSEILSKFDVANRKTYIQKMNFQNDRQKVAPMFNEADHDVLHVVLASTVKDEFAPMLNQLRNKCSNKIHNSDNIDEKTTHFVVPDRYCRRTVRFFAAVSLSIWIVSVDWLQASIRLGRPAPEHQFEVCGTTKDKLSNGPKLSRLNKLWMQPPLFASIYIFCRDISQETQQLLVNAGAKIASREPKCDADLLAEHNTFLYHANLDDNAFKVNFLIVYEPNFEGSSSKVRLNSKRIKTVSSPWIYECLQSFKILPFEF